MTTKDKVLGIFEAAKGTYFSGEELAQKLQVSRTAVWKAVKLLRDEGYCIDAVTNKGYSLSENTDILSAQGVRQYLPPACREREIQVLPTVTGTNAYVKERAAEGHTDGYTVLANEQTAGRGRAGRTFFSPAGTGLYMSLLLTPQHCPARRAVRVTTMAAVAMCEAIREVTGEPAQIKWVNDIFLHGKKVCGILTEASLDMESGRVEYAVLGVGLNVYPPEQGFPEELSSVAGYIADTPREDLKNRLAAAFIRRFTAYYTAADGAAYMEKYRQYCFVIGRPVTVIADNRRREATVQGVDEECRLQVVYEDGTQEHLAYGEIETRFPLPEA